MRKLALAGAMALALAGCSTAQKVFDAIQEATIPGSKAVIIANVYDGIELTAAGYLEQPKCGKTASVICRDPRATAQIIPAVRSGRVLRNQIEICLQLQSCPQTLTDKLAAINDTLKGVFTQYNIH